MAAAFLPKEKRGCAVFGRLPGRGFAIILPREEKNIPKGTFFRQESAKEMQKWYKLRY